MVGVLRRDGFTLGAWRVEPRRNRIVSAEQERGLDPRLIDVLVQLAARPGDVITREELLETVWEGVFVSENTLSQVILPPATRAGRRLAPATLHRDDRQVGLPAGRSGSLERRHRAASRRVGAERLGAAVGCRPDGGTPADLAPATPAPAIAPEPAPDEIPPVATPSPAQGCRGPTRSSRANQVRLLVVASIALAAVLGWVFRDALAPATIAPPVIVPESTLVGRQFEPVLSPAGDRLVFAWRGPNEDAPFDLWTQSIGGDAPTRITETPADFERLPAWSSDGQSVTYLRANPQEQVCGFYRSPVAAPPWKGDARSRRGSRPPCAPPCR